MPDQRKHRGPHPEDADLFGPPQLCRLQQAVEHTAWLLTRGYAAKSSIQLVGDRFQLTARQRLAVLRCSCSDDSRDHRNRRQVTAQQLAGQRIELDGFNVLTTIEAALAGGVILLGRDGCFRDMASMHGSYRKVEETRPALELAGRYLAACGVGPCTWFLDRPVSNSGRLGQLIVKLATENRWAWDVRIEFDVDGALKDSDHIVASADSVVLDHCGRWFNLARFVVAHFVHDACWVDLGGDESNNV